MSDSKKIPADEIMALHDGELGPGRARDVAERLEESEGGKAQLAGLSTLGDLVRAHYGRAAQESDASIASAWTRLEAKLGPPPRAARPGFFATLLENLRPKLGYALVGAIGVAAGALLVARLSGKNPIQMVMPGPVVIQQGEPVAQVAAVPPTDTDVDEVDTPGRSAMIYQVPSESADKPATTVIWVTDDAPTENPI